MYHRKILLSICFFCLFACVAFPQEKPSEMFIKLYEKYRKTEYETRTISTRGEGAGMFVFDVNKKMAKDIFCRLEFFSTSGQTQYLVYKKNGEDIWYFHKKAYFYDKPFELENAEIINTYFKYTNNLPYAFNDKTGKYDMQADTDKYQAVTDVRSLADIIDIVQNARSESEVSEN